MPAVRPGNADRDPPPEVLLDRDAVAAALDVLDELARLTLAASGDCALAAAQISTRVQGSDALWQHLSEMSRDSEREKILIRAQESLSKKMEAFADALGPCAFDRRIRMSLEPMAFSR